MTPELVRLGDQFIAAAGHYVLNPKRIAFSAKREGDDAAQIYLLDVTAAGEAQRLTSLSTGARAPQFSPVNDAILYTINAYPNAADDDAQKKIAK